MTQWPVDFGNQRLVSVCEPVHGPSTPGTSGLSVSVNQCMARRLREPAARQCPVNECMGPSTPGTSGSSVSVNECMARRLREPADYQCL